MMRFQTFQIRNAGASAPGDGVGDKDIDRFTLRSFAKSTPAAYRANILPAVLIALCCFSIPDWRSMVALLLCIAATNILTCIVALRIADKLDREDISSDLRIHTILSFLSGLFSAAITLPLGESLGKNVASLIVCVIVIASYLVTCMMVATQRRTLWAYIAGFQILLVPLAFLFHDLIGLVPAFAIMGLVPTAHSLTKVIREQTLLMIRTQIENQKLAERLADALQASEFVARRDSLTGLLNRRAFEEFALGMKEQAEMAGTPLGLILIDLDHFKAINDGFGHSMGDEVLKSTAGLIQDVVGPLDFTDCSERAIARWGGEEFIILLNDCAQDRAILLAEEVRRKLATCRASNWPREMDVSGSFGVAAWPEGAGLHDAIEWSDEAMYCAKVNGRNRTFVYTSSSCVSAQDQLRRSLRSAS